MMNIITELSQHHIAEVTTFRRCIQLIVPQKVLASSTPLGIIMFSFEQTRYGISPHNKSTT